MVMQDNGQQRPNAEGDATNNPLKLLKGSVKGYHEPFEPVGIEDWEVLDLEDDMTAPGGSS